MTLVLVPQSSFKTGIGIGRDEHERGFEVEEGMKEGGGEGDSDKVKVPGGSGGGGDSSSEEEGVKEVEGDEVTQMMNSSFYINTPPEQQGSEGERSPSVSSSSASESEGDGDEEAANDREVREILEELGPTPTPRNRTADIVRFDLPEDLTPDGNWGLVIAHDEDPGEPKHGEGGGGSAEGGIILSVELPRGQAGSVGLEEDDDQIEVEDEDDDPIILDVEGGEEDDDDNGTCQGQQDYWDWSQMMEVDVNSHSSSEVEVDYADTSDEAPQGSLRLFKMGEVEDAMRLILTSKVEGPSDSASLMMSMTSLESNQYWMPGFVAEEAPQLPPNPKEEEEIVLEKKSGTRKRTGTGTRTRKRKSRRGGSDSSKQDNSQNGGSEDIPSCLVVLTRCDQLPESPERSEPRRSRRMSSRVPVPNRSRSSRGQAPDPEHDLAPRRKHRRKSPTESGGSSAKKPRGMGPVGQRPSSSSTRPYQCTHCPLRFAEPGTLKCHIFTHTKEKPYKCKVCSMGFRQAGTRNRHMFVKHFMTELPYKCPICSRGFSQKGNLNVHMFAHNGGEPYKCPECSKRFSQYYTMRRHLKDEHGGGSDFSDEEGG